MYKSQVPKYKKIKKSLNEKPSSQSIQLGWPGSNMSLGWGLTKKVPYLSFKLKFEIH